MGDTKGTDWMYNPNAEMNKEEYLLGKAIGKNFENEGTMGQINAVEYDCAPPSIFASQAAHQVDLQRKLIEDPLVAIKKRELEDRRKILDNPVKMKALQEHIEDLKRKKKDKKKKKKRKKTKGSDSDDSDADLDLKLLKRIQKMEEGGAGGDSDDEFEDPGARSESPVERKRKDQRRDDSPPSRRQRSGGSPNKRQRHEDSPSRRKRSRSPFKRRQSSDSPPRRRRSPDSPRRRKRSPETQPRRRNRSPDSPPRRRRSPDSPHRRKISPESPPRRRRSPESGRRSPYRRERKYSRSPARRPRSPHRRKPRSPSDSPPRIKERSPYKRKTSSPSSSPPRRKSPTMSPPPKKKAGLDIGRNYRKKSPVAKLDRENSSKKVATGPTKKAALTDSEKQAKLAEMMANATWRDQQRTSRVQTYREGVEKEEAEASKEHDKNFINRELKRAQENLTVEGRITANKYKIQRGHGDMDKNFARR